MISACLLWAALAAGEARPDLAASIAAIRAVGNEGKNNVEASEGWKQLSQATAEQLPDLLNALNGANSLAANWIRSAIDAVVDRTLAAKGELPLEKIEAFIKQQSNDPRGRRLAFEILKRGDARRAEAMVPSFKDDSSVELRRDAVALLMDRAAALLKENKKDDAKAAYSTSLAAARDQDQIDAAAAKLGELGQKVDLAKHFGFILDWKVVGPFDSTNFKGFDKAYPPESKVDLAAEYDGKIADKKVSWKPHVTTDAYGMVDLNKAIGKHKWAAAYAYTEFTSDKDQEVEFRLGSITSWKLWLNGEPVFGQDEYHKGIAVDQYRVTGKLKAGVNRLLVKVCQNNQMESWAQDWQFQVRVCDPTGTAILSTTRPDVTSEIKPKRYGGEPKAKAKPAKEKKA